MGGPEAEMGESEAAMLRFRTTLRSPGCVHIILESISPKVPFLLENRSSSACRYRQRRPDKGPEGKLPWQLLPPWSAAGFAWQPIRQQDKPYKVGTLCLLESDIVVCGPLFPAGPHSLDHTIPTFSQPTCKQSRLIAM